MNSSQDSQHETVACKGDIFEVVKVPRPDGRVFEIARRAPGVRLIIADKSSQKVLLIREFRHEFNDWDYRLPGGKVFDTLEEYKQFRQSGEDVLLPAREKAVGEGLEEAGIILHEFELFQKSTLGATIEWDLLVFEVIDWSEVSSGQQLEQGEEIEANNWFSYNEAKEMIIRGEVREERIALVLLRWLELQSTEGPA